MKRLQEPQLTGNSLTSAAAWTLGQTGGSRQLKKPTQGIIDCLRVGKRLLHVR